MTSEPSNIVNLRDSLPPLQQVDTAPGAAPVPASHRSGLPLSLKVLFAMVIGMAGVAMAYLGYTGQWPRVPVASAPASESTLPVAPPARPDAPPVAHRADAPARDVLNSINVDPTPVAPPTAAADPLARDVGPAPDVADDSASRDIDVQAIRPESQAPLSPDPLAPSRSAAASVSNDISLAYQNQARIEAIEGYIVEMLTVIESHKTELRAMQASLDKNTTAIDQQMQRVAALMQQRAAPRDVAPSAKTPATIDSPTTALPFRVTSIRQFGETLSIRVEDTRGTSRLMVTGQRLNGWQLLTVDPDRRRAEFVHLESRTHQEAGL
ncbi:hypothetical protein ACSV5M_21420 [Cellvibrio sp. ARAG 10.3]|uniref:hypothetical protein n=1 Tax=Cellvibrio sp. ARAG 10.3 TaxID=3451358 RepID=UPI003F454F4B